MKSIILFGFLVVDGANANYYQDDLERQLVALQAKIDALESRVPILLQKIDVLENSVEDNENLIDDLEYRRGLQSSCSFIPITAADGSEKCRYHGELRVNGDVDLANGNMYITGPIGRRDLKADHVDNKHGNPASDRALPIIPDFSSSSFVVETSAEVDGDLIIGDTLWIKGDTLLYKKLAVQGETELGDLRVVRDLYVATNATFNGKVDTRGKQNTMTIEGNIHALGKSAIEGTTDFEGKVYVTEDKTIGVKNPEMIINGKLKLTGGTILFEDDTEFQDTLNVDKLTVKKSCRILVAGVYQKC